MLLTSCLTSLDLSVLQIKTKTVSCLTADSKPVKQEVNRTVILPPLVFPGLALKGKNYLENSSEIPTYLRVFAKKNKSKIISSL